MKLKDRVVVQFSKARKYGTIVAESKDGLSWLVLIDGNRQTQYVHKDKVELLKPEQLAFHWGETQTRSALK